MVIGDREWNLFIYWRGYYKRNIGRYRSGGGTGGKRGRTTEEILGYARRQNVLEKGEEGNKEKILWGLGEVQEG